MWQYNEIKKELVVLHKFLLLGSSISRGVKKQSKSDLEMGVTCIDFRLAEDVNVYVGCENGGVFRCFLDPAKSRSVQNREKDGSYMAPQTKSYTGHTAAVNAVKLSVHLIDVFATCSSDMTVQVLYFSYPLVNIPAGQLGKKTGVGVDKILLP